MKPAVVLLSGGVDSATAVSFAHIFTARLLLPASSVLMTKYQITVRPI